MCLFSKNLIRYVTLTVSPFQKIDELKNASTEFLSHVNGLAPPPVMSRYSVKEAGKQNALKNHHHLKFLINLSNTAVA